MPNQDTWKYQAAQASRAANAPQAQQQQWQPQQQQEQPGSDLFGAPPETTNYWENPQTVARWYNLIEQSPPDSIFPEWLDVDGITQAYQYYEEANQGKNWEEWGKFQDTDPALQFVRSLTAPPVDAVWPGEEWLALQNAEPQPGYYETGGFDQAAFDALPWTQKALYYIFSTGGRTDPSSELAASVRSGMASALVPSIVEGGLAGAVEGGPIGAAIGAGSAAGIGMGLGGSLGALGHKYPWLATAFNALDILSEGVERVTGTLALLGLGALGGIEEHYTGKTKVIGFNAQDVLHNLDAAWAAAHMTYDIPNKRDVIQELGIPTVELGWDEVGYQALANMYMAIRDEQKKPNQVWAEYQAMYGFTGQMRDMLARSLADPLNFVGLGLTKLGATAAKAKGATLLAEALQQSSGLLEGTKKYGNMLLAKETTPTISKMGAFTRWVAGVSPEGKIRGLDLPKGQLITPFGTMKVSPKVSGAVNKIGGAGLGGVFGGLVGSAAGPGGTIVGALAGSAGGSYLGLGYLAHLTPVAQAHEWVGNSGIVLGQLLNLADSDPVKLTQYIKSIGNTNPELASLISTKLMDTPYGSAVAMALRDFGTTADDLLASWHGTEWSRGMLENIAKVTDVGVDEVLHDLGNTKDAQTLLSRYVDAAKNSTDEAAKNIVAAYDAGDLTPQALQDFVKSFIKDGTPYKLDEYKSKLYMAAMTHMDDWAAKWFNIKPDATLIRMSKLVKSAQSLVLLGLNPTYFINNVLNNWVTTAAHGVFGLRSMADIEAFWGRMGGMPERLKQGVGISGDLTPIQYKAMSKAAQKGDWIDRGIKLFGDLNETIGIFSKASSKMESLSSAQAYTTGTIKARNKLWKPGVGFERMPPQLETALALVNPDFPQFIYDVIQRSMNKKEIESALWTGMARRGVDSFVPEVAQAMGMTPTDLKDLLTDTNLYTYLEDKLRTANTNEEVRQAFFDLHNEMQRHFDQAFIDDIKAEAALATQKMKTEGVQAVLEISSEIALRRAEREIEGYAHWENVYSQQDELSPGEFGKLVQQQFGIEDRAWRRVWANEDASYWAMAEAMGIDNTEAREFILKFRENSQNWTDFHKERQRRYREFFNTIFTNRQTRSQAWDNLQKELGKLYAQHVEVEKRLTKAMDSYFVGWVKTQWGDAASAAAQYWRDGLLDIYTETTEGMKAHREVIRNSRVTKGGRRFLWTEYINNVRRPQTFEMLRRKVQGAIDLYNTITGKGPAPMQQPAGAPQGPTPGAPPTAAATPQAVPTPMGPAPTGVQAQMPMPTAPGAVRPPELGASPAVKEMVANAPTPLETAVEAMKAPGTTEVGVPRPKPVPDPVLAMKAREIAAEFGVETRDSKGQILWGQDNHILSVVNQFGVEPGQEKFRVLGEEGMTPEIVQKAFDERQSWIDLAGPADQPKAPVPEVQAAWQTDLVSELPSDVSRNAITGMARQMLGELDSGFGGDGQVNVDWYHRIYYEGYTSRSTIRNAIEKIAFGNDFNIEEIVPRELFGPDTRVEVGKTFKIEIDGRKTKVEIVSIGDEGVHVKYNHPLAGKDKHGKYMGRIKELIVDRLIGDEPSPQPPNPAMLLELGETQRAIDAFGQWAESGYFERATDAEILDVVGDAKAYDILSEMYNKQQAGEELPNLSNEPTGAEIAEALAPVVEEVVSREAVNAATAEWSDSINNPLQNDSTPNLRDRFMEMTFKAGIDNQKDVDAVMEVYDSVAKVWAKQNNSSEREFWGKVVRDIETLPIDPNAYPDTYIPHPDELNQAWSRSLMTLHNLTQENLIHADELGGLAAPSVAIIKKEQPFGSYGEITLVGNKNLIDPQRDTRNRIFAADAYSPTWPDTIWKKVKMKDARAVHQVLYATAMEFQDYSSTSMIWDAMVNYPNKKKALEVFDRYNAPKAAFLREQGYDVHPIVKTREPRFGWLDYGVIDFLDGIDPEILQINAPNQLIPELKEVITSAINQYATEKFTDLNPTYVDKYVQNIIDDMFGESDTLVLNAWDRLLEDYRRVKNPETYFDHSETFDMLNKLMKENNLIDQYELWAKDLLSVFGEPQIKLRGKKVPYNLRNIVEAMTTRNPRAKEKGLGFSKGHAKAVGAKELKSVGAMHKAEWMLQPREVVHAAIDAQDSVFDPFIHAIINKSQYGVFEANDDAMRAVGTYLKNRKTRDPEFMERCLAVNGFRVKDITPSDIEKALDFAEVLRDTPTEYFEGKLQRAVGLDEFSGAVVPDNVDPKVLEILERHGLRVETYPLGNIAERQIAVSKIQGEPGVLFQQGEPALRNGDVIGKIWYNKSESVINKLQMETMTVDQLAAALKKGGIRADEMKWLGLDDFLESRTGKVTKQEVLDYIAQNNIEIKEVVKGGPGKQPVISDVSDYFDYLYDPSGNEVDAIYHIEMGDKAQELPGYLYTVYKDKEGRYQIYNDMGSWQAEYYDYSYVVEWANEQMGYMTEGESPKYPGYTVPGGNNYRELLLTLPDWGRVEYTIDDVKSIRRENILASVTFKDGKSTAVFYDSFGPPYSDAQIKAAAIERMKNQGRNKPSYQSGHWQEENIFSHVRFDERVDADGNRVLMVLEIQSDWHQTASRLRMERINFLMEQDPKLSYKDARSQVAKDYGYMYSKNLDSQIEEVRKLRDANYEEINKFVSMLSRKYNETKNIDNLLSKANAEEVEKYTALQKEADKIKLNIDSLQNAYSYQVPQAPFADTWPELSMKRMIRWAAENGYDKVAFPTGELAARIEGQQIITNISEMNYYPELGALEVKQRGVGNDWREIEGYISPEDLEKYVSYDIAEQILQQEPGEGGALHLYTDDVTFGGEKMRWFYDRNLVNQTNKLLKKWGVEVGTAAINEHNPDPRYWKENEIWYVEWLADPKRLEYESKTFNSKLEAQEFADNIKTELATKVHSIDITPEMKQSVLVEGQPKFQMDQRVKKGSVLPFDDGSVILRLYQDSADISTLLHEGGHILRRILPTGDMDIVTKWLLDEYNLEIGHSDGRFIGPQGKYTYNGKDYDSAAVFAEEQFARAFERYVTEGIAPKVKGLQAVFDRLKATMLQIYSQIKGSDIDVPLNDDLRALFDRWLGGGDPKFEEPTYNWFDTEGGPARLFGQDDDGNWMYQMGDGEVKSTGVFTSIDTTEFKDWFGNSKVVDADGKPLRVFHGTKSPVDFDTFSTSGPPIDDYGYDIVGSSVDPSAYMGAHFAQESEVAGQFAGVGETWQQSRYSEGYGRIYPVYLSIENPMIFATEQAMRDFMFGLDMGNSYDVDWYAENYAYDNDIDVEEFYRMYDEDIEFRRETNENIVLSDLDNIDEGPTNQFSSDIGMRAREELQRQGFDGVRYSNDVEGGISWIAFEDTQIKSTFNDGSWSKQTGEILHHEGLPPESTPPSTVNNPIGTHDALNPAPPLRNIEEQNWNETVWPMLLELQRRMTGADATRGAKLNNTQLDSKTLDALQNYLVKVYGQQAETNVAAIKWGENRRDAALLNYRARTGMDSVASMIWPYEFFYTRQMLNWGMHAIDHPAFLAQWARFKKLQQQPEKEGYPHRLVGKMGFKWPWAPDWMGKKAYIDPLGKQYPIEMILSPFMSIADQQSQEGRRAEYILQGWVADETITEQDMTQALQAQDGDLWNKAMAQAKVELESELSNPFDYVNLISGPMYPLAIANQWINGRKDSINQLPVTRFLQAITAWTTPGGYNLEKGVRQKFELPERGELWNLYMTRQLSNMAANGEITNEEAELAMVEQGGEAWNKAMDQVGQVQAWRYFLSWIGLDFFPEGEQTQRQLQTYYGDWIKYGLDKSEFFERYPEYSSRLRAFGNWDDPDSMKKAWTIGALWDTYYELPALHQKEFREQAPDFGTRFLSKDRDYDAIELDTLVKWLEMMGGDLPSTIESSGAKQVYMSDEQVTELYQQYSDVKDQNWPGIWAIQNEYYAIKDNQGYAAAQQYKAQHPELEEFWRWNRQQYQAYPILEAINKGKGFTEDGPVLNIDPRQIDPYVQSSLLGYFYAGEELAPGAQAELQRLWKQSGKPGGTFETFLTMLRYMYIW